MMEIYIPKGALKDPGNEEKIRAIMDRVPTGDVVVGDDHPLDRALEKIRELGEGEVADLISMR